METKTWIKVRAVPNEGIYVQCPCCYEEYLVTEKQIKQESYEIKCNKCGLTLPFQKRKYLNCGNYTGSGGSECLNGSLSYCSVCVNFISTNTKKLL